MPGATAGAYGGGAAPASWPWLAAGGALLVAGLAAFLVSPKLGILALGLPAAPLVILYPQIGLLAVIALIPFDSIASLVPSRTLTLTRLAGMAVVGGWVVNVLVRRSRVTLGTPGLFLVAYVVFALTSFLWTPAPAESVQKAKTLVQLLLLYVMAVNLLRTPDALVRALDVLLVSTAVVALVIILQYDPEEASRASLRLGEQAANPNYLAAMLVGPAVAAAALGAAGRRFAAWRSFAFGLISLATVVTGSRGGMLGLALGTALVGALRPRFGLRLALGVALILPACPLVVPRPVIERQIERFQRVGEDRGSGRLDIWNVGMSMVRHNPMIGQGFGSFEVSFYRYLYGGDVAVDPRWAIQNVWGQRAAHNVYLSTAAELGVVGLGLLLLALGAHAAGPLRVVRRASEVHGNSGPVAVALLGMFTSLLLMSNTCDTFGTKETWLLLALMQAGALRAPGRVR